jgi:hypothetical protein
MMTKKMKNERVSLEHSFRDAVFRCSSIYIETAHWSGSDVVSVKISKREAIRLLSQIGEVPDAWEIDLDGDLLISSY